MTLQLINRSPEPGEENALLSSNIELDIANDLATGVDLATTQVYVDGVLAFDAGTFQTGFTGTDSAHSAPFTDIRRIVIDPNSDFISEAEVTVRVVSTDGAAASLDSTYSFFIEDLTAPQVSNALGTSLDTVQVTFNEGMDAVSATVPGSYTLAPLSAPAVPASVVSVAATGAPEVYILTMDRNLSHGITYQLTVSGPEDDSGNAVAIPFDTASFVAFTPQIPAGRFFDLWSGMIPRKNRQEDATGDLRKLISVWQEVIDQSLFAIDAWTDILDPDIAPEPFVDAMLCDLGNPFDFVLSLTDKRRLVRVLVDIYKEKGIARGIINAIRFFMGIEVTITPAVLDGGALGVSLLGIDWELGPGDVVILYTFDLNAPEALTDEQRDRIISIVDYMKPAHTHLGSIIEPETPIVIDHWQLSLSELSIETVLH